MRVKEEYDIFGQIQEAFGGKHDYNSAKTWIQATLDLKVQEKVYSEEIRISWKNEYPPMELRQCFSAGLWPGG